MTTLTFTTSGTWQAVIDLIDCQCTGEGGDGAEGEEISGHPHIGGGGGGGAYAEETALALTVDDNYTYTIGTGGSSTATSFPGNSVTVKANYGASASGEDGGAGGAAGSNSIAYAGDAGENGAEGSGGDGGDAAGPGGSGTGGAGGAGVDGDGGAGTAPGGGGGGGGPGEGEGGAGAAGQIVIIYTIVTAGTATLSGVGTLTNVWNVLNLTSPPGPSQPGRTWLRRFGFGRTHVAQPGRQIQTFRETAVLSGIGTLTAIGGPVAPAVVNSWSNSYGQGTTFTSLTPALQSCQVPLTPAYSVGGGSGTPTAGNWLFTIATWTQDPSIANVHVGTSDDIHSWWRQYPAGGSGGYSRCSVSYTANTARMAGNVYVAPDMEVAAINVLVVEVQGLGPWDVVTGTDTNYAAAATSLSLSLPAPSQAAFIIGATGGDNASSGQAFLPSGWYALPTQTQGNGVNTLADNILTAAYLPSTTGSVSVTGTAVTAEDISGFLLGVEVSGTSPIPAGHNPGWPYLIFEAAFGSGFNTPDSEMTWTDISTRLWNWDETTGIQYQLGQIQATQLELQLDNYDGALSPANTGSAYYPYVIPGTPVRIRAALGSMGGVNYDRWYILQRNATEWGEEITDAFRRYSPVRGTDLWAALSAIPPSFYRALVIEDGPYAWWPMDDQPLNANILPTFLLNAAEGNTNVMDILLSPLGGISQPYVGGSGLLPPGLPVYTVGANAGWMFGDPQGTVPTLSTGNPVTAQPGSASWQASGQGGTTGSYGFFLSCNDDSFPPLSGGVTVEIWFNYAFWLSGYAAGTVNEEEEIEFIPARQQPDGIPLTIWELATASAPVCLLQLDTSGFLWLITYNGSTATSSLIYDGCDLRSESWHMATVTLTETTWTVWLDGGANAQVSGTATGMTSAWTYLICNGDLGGGGGGAISGIENGGNVALSHLAVYPCVLPYYRIMTHYWAAVTAFGQLPAPTGVKITWTSPSYGVSAHTLSGTPYTESNPDGTPVAFNAVGISYPVWGPAPTGNSSYYGVTTPNAAGSATIVAQAPGGVTSGPSAWVVNTSVTLDYVDISGVGPEYNVFYQWITWNGISPSAAVYTSAAIGNDTEAGTVNGNSASFECGYGADTYGVGICQTAAGTGTSPPVSASAIGDIVGQRIERLMHAGKCASPKRSIDQAPLLVQAPGNQGGGIQVGASIQAIQESDGGLLYVDNCGNLIYWQRPHLASQYSSPVWQIGPTTSAGRIPYYKEIHWVVDPHRIWNAITIAPFSPEGAELPLITPQNALGVLESQIQYGAQPYQVISWLQSQTEMQNQANWLFTEYGQGVRRAERVVINAAAYPPAWELVLGVNVGDVVQLEDWIIGGGGSVYTYRVTQVRRHLSFGSHEEEVEARVELTLDAEPSSYWS